MGRAATTAAGVVRRANERPGGVGRKRGREGEREGETKVKEGCEDATCRKVCERVTRRSAAIVHISTQNTHKTHTVLATPRSVDENKYSGHFHPAVCHFLRPFPSVRQEKTSDGGTTAHNFLWGNKTKLTIRRVRGCSTVDESSPRHPIPPHPTPRQYHPSITRTFSGPS